ncbi:hypothetical protein B9W62_26450 [Streptomyces sp. CS113]|uniref:hypothetical protein n=1 Tax=Streptomyces sp. CS113 TaxID=1982761 RepID=UPI000B40A968|nr:hypothetical protein [Streptomyces sp. CS113]OWA03810.1 hypothetical protein B9W62_26450 [Streptomyces sp. CS113]
MSLNDWPVPPPFLWAGEQCSELLWLCASAYTADESDPGRDHAARLQVTLSRHVADEHPADVPEPHTDDCPQRESYSRRADVRDEKLWAEHRARGLFLPPVAARLL